MQGRAHPPGFAGAQGLASIIVAEGLQLRRRGQAHVHQLDFIHYPQAVVVQQPELHRPAGAAGGVAAIQRTADQHVLGSHQNGFALGFDLPGRCVSTTHQGVHRHRCRAAAEALQGSGDLGGHLLNQDAHGQAPDQAARPDVILPL